VSGRSEESYETAWRSTRIRGELSSGRISSSYKDGTRPCAEPEAIEVELSAIVLLSGTSMSARRAPMPHSEKGPLCPPRAAGENRWRVNLWISHHCVHQEPSRRIEICLDSIALSLNSVPACRRKLSSSTMDQRMAPGTFCDAWRRTRPASPRLSRKTWRSGARPQCRRCRFERSFSPYRR